ncbi:MAG TPA: MBL fold metallo-hydrolase [Elusimicrobiota bacterium]|nr:MBL fold metallo-hydrolase [Elusimicrobiota bacterium]
MRRLLLLFVMIGVAACGGRKIVKGTGDPLWGLRVRWHGHSCFSFEDSVGRTVLIDPFDETVGYVRPSAKPDAVLITHDHFDHADPRWTYVPRPSPLMGSREKPDEDPVKMEKGKGRDRKQVRMLPEGVFCSTGTFAAADGIEVRSMRAFHDPVNGRRHGTTQMYVWSMGGLTLAHMGDIGQDRLTPEQIEFLKGADVLMIPVGGGPTIDAVRAAEFVRLINPRIVIPMHYGNPLVRFAELDSLESFLKQFERIDPWTESQRQIQADQVPAGPTVMVPALPSRRNH